VGNATFVAKKVCLEGTRVDILGDIVGWINNLEPDTPWVLWLYGQAGKGKSAIAHMIASWFKSHGALGSCFCFTHDQQVEHCHEKIFTTIACDLADHDPTFKWILAKVIAGDKALSTTCDVEQHWEKFILGPISKVSMSLVEWVVIVIDALDESGVEASRKEILSILASAQVTKLPSSIHILITSCPLPDITEALQDIPHITCRSMGDISTSHYGVRIFSGSFLHYCCRSPICPALRTASPRVPVHCLAHIFPACSLSPPCSWSARSPRQSCIKDVLWSS